jgi:hypothetical protein
LLQRTQAAKKQLHPPRHAPFWRLAGECPLCGVLRFDVKSSWWVLLSCPLALFFFGSKQHIVVSSLRYVNFLDLMDYQQGRNNNVNLVKYDEI